MDKRELEYLVSERDGCIERLDQAKSNIQRLRALRVRTQDQERALFAAQKIVADGPAQIAMFDARLAAAVD